MINFKTLRWGNCFSYGDNNELKLDENRITQLVGQNGHGKSSIPLVIEEVLFNKNSKGIKKAEIPNRLLDGGYWMEIDFSDGDVEYTVSVQRKSSIKITVLKDGEDISSHTATATFETIKDILGTDFKVFFQIFYKSNTVGLEFLTATDANRKKFLIDLFSLEEYLELHEKYKERYRVTNLEVKELQGKMDFVEAWLKDNNLKNKEIIDLKPEAEMPEDDELREKASKLKDIKSLNRKINDNNKLKELLENTNYDKELASKSPIDLSSSHTRLGSVTSKISDLERKLSTIKYHVVDTSYLELEKYEPPLEERAEVQAKLSVAKDTLRKMNSLTDNECPTCTQEITEEFKKSHTKSAEEEIDMYTQKLQSIDLRIKEAKDHNSKVELNKANKERNLKLADQEEAIKSEIEELKNEKDSLSAYINSNKEEAKAIEEAKKGKQEWESIYVRIDRELPETIYQAEELEAEIAEPRESFEAAKELYREILEFNKNAVRHNTEVEVFEKESKKYEDSFNEISSKLEVLEDRVSKLDTLKSALSTRGLVAFKLENFVKELEEETNNYLANLSDGRFILEFTIDKDKLNVVIVDDGEEITINSLSSGELARVNCSTLLAIRKLMSKISKTQINILFLDEIINVLDDEGREKLVEVLMEENDLNTFLVSHGWTHPLISRIQVVKEDGISRLEG